MVPVVFPGLQVLPLIPDRRGITEMNILGPVFISTMGFLTIKPTGFCGDIYVVVVGLLTTSTRTALQGKTRDLWFTYLMFLMLTMCRRTQIA
jgi:hypothetical protein